LGRQCQRGYEESVYRRQGGLPIRGHPAYRIAMPIKDDDRARRLAEALRANLKRRKAQARDAAEGEGATPSPELSKQPRSPS
jgi:hypothetical protein